MRKKLSRVQTLTVDEYLPQQAFYAAIALVCATLFLMVAGLGLLGVFHIPQGAPISRGLSLFCTTFGGSLAAVFAASSAIFTQRAHLQLEANDRLELKVRKSFTLMRNNKELTLLNKVYHKRSDLLDTISKEQKIECLRPGEWVLHCDNKNAELLCKFYIATANNKRKICTVNLRVHPFTGHDRTTNVYFDPWSEKLLLYKEGKYQAFEGVLATNYLIQKTWIFMDRYFDTLTESNL